MEILPRPLMGVWWCGGGGEGRRAQALQGSSNPGNVTCVYMCARVQCGNINTGQYSMLVLLLQ